MGSNGVLTPFFHLSYPILSYKTRANQQEVDGMKPEEALSLIEQGIRKPPKPRRVAPASSPQPILDRGLGLGFGGKEEEEEEMVVDVKPKASERF